MKTTYYPVGHLHDFSKLSILTWNDMREFIDSLKAWGKTMGGTFLTS